MMKTIDRTGLERWTLEQQAFALVDVLPDDLSQALSAETMPRTHSHADFIAQMAGLEHCKEQPVVLYEASSASVPSYAAAHMLEHAGFGNVYRFVGPQTSIHMASHGPALQENKSA